MRDLLWAKLRFPASLAPGVPAQRQARYVSARVSVRAPFRRALQEYEINRPGGRRRIQRLCDRADVRPFEKKAVREGLRNADAAEQSLRHGGVAPHRRGIAPSPGSG
jgi:hypothetical protein